MWAVTPVRNIERCHFVDGLFIKESPHGKDV